MCVTTGLDEWMGFVSGPSLVPKEQLCRIRFGSFKPWVDITTNLRIVSTKIGSTLLSMEVEAQVRVLKVPLWDKGTN